MNIEICDFGKKDDKIAKTFLLSNKNGMKVKLTNLGAIVISIFVPDKDNITRDVVLGFDDFKDYEINHCYFGSTIGRNGNRIGNSTFFINGIQYFLDKNEGNNNLHSGFNGYNKRFWDYEVNERSNAVKFSLFSPDGDQGFPGNFDVSVTYILTDENELKINYSGKCDQDTIANLTNHSYFNLDGQDFGTAINQSLWLKSSNFVVVDNQSIPTGKLQYVENTPMDFRTIKAISDEINADFEQLKLTKGYDHSFVIDKDIKGIEKVALLKSAKSGINMEVYTDCPCLQFYAGNYIDDVPQAGKKNHIYENRSAICLETGFIPDAINNDSFESPILKKGDTYDSTTIYKFI